MAEEKQTKGERARQVILDTAYGLFVRQGYAATSMRDIAKTARMAPGSIYNHFASKEELFRAIVSERHPFFQVIPLLNKVKGESVSAYCRNAAHTLVDEMGHHPEFLNLALIEIVEFKAVHAPDMIENLLPHLIPLAERLKGLNGRVRRIPSLVLARAFLGMFLSYYITGVLLGNTIPEAMPEKALDHFVDIFLHGILVKETA